MLKEDYDLIAACIGAAYAYNANDTRSIADLEQRLCLEMSLANPRFDTNEFATRIEYWRKAHLS